jgi:hypothetical protein
MKKLVAKEAKKSLMKEALNSIVRLGAKVVPNEPNSTKAQQKQKARRASKKLVIEVDREFDD